MNAASTHINTYSVSSHPREAHDIDHIEADEPTLREGWNAQWITMIIAWSETVSGTLVTFA